MSPAQRWTLIAAILGSGIVFLDSTVVNVALPRIGRELPSGIFGVLEGQSYVYNGYLLTVSALLILAGALNDFYGRKRMFVIGLSGFLATSVLCGHDRRSLRRRRARRHRLVARCLLPECAVAVRRDLGHVDLRRGITRRGCVEPVRLARRFRGRPRGRRAVVRRDLRPAA